MQKVKSLHLHTLFIIEILFGFFAAVGSVLLFKELVEHVFYTNTLAFDKTIAYAIYTIRNPLLTQIMMGISFMGAEMTIIGGSIAIIAFVYYHRRRDAAFLGAIMVIGLALNTVLKSIYQRPRPDMSPLIHLLSFSFPSGHSMNGFIFYSLLTYFIYHLTHNKRYTVFAGIFSGIMILLIGLSRVYLGVHYPTDVLGGYLAGFFVVITAILLKQTDKVFRKKI